MIFFFCDEVLLNQPEPFSDLNNIRLTDNLGVIIEKQDFNGIIEQFHKTSGFFININTISNKESGFNGIITSDV